MTGVKYYKQDFILQFLLNIIFINFTIFKNILLWFTELSINVTSHYWLIIILFFILLCSLRVYEFV